MGRYYKGDIEGKFWFGVQSSTDASFFGGEEYEPSYMEYYFDKDDLGEINAGIDKCKKELGDYKEKLDAFFGEGGEGHEGYNDEMIEKSLSISAEKVLELLQWYARLHLGEKIRDRVVDSGSCEFRAEL